MTATGNAAPRPTVGRSVAVRIVTVDPDGHATAEDLVLTVDAAAARFGAPTAALLLDPDRGTPSLTPADARRRYGHQAAALIFPAGTDQACPAGGTVEHPALPLDLALQVTP